MTQQDQIFCLVTFSPDCLRVFCIVDTSYNFLLFISYCKHFFRFLNLKNFLLYPQCYSSRISKFILLLNLEILKIIFLRILNYDVIHVVSYKIRDVTIKILYRESCTCLQSFLKHLQKFDSWIRPRLLVWVPTAEAMVWWDFRSRWITLRIEKKILKTKKIEKNVRYTKDSAENSKHLGSTTSWSYSLKKKLGQNYSRLLPSCKMVSKWIS